MVRRGSTLQLPGSFACLCVLVCVKLFVLTAGYEPLRRILVARVVRAGDSDLGLIPGFRVGIHPSMGVKRL